MQNMRKKSNNSNINETDLKFEFFSFFCIYGKQRICNRYCTINPI